jgi:predicted Zn-ribbon and HTH transcriptional regulator
MSAWSEYKKKNGDAKPWHLLSKSNHVSIDLSDHRYSICLECPELIAATKQCKKCGCFMFAKTKIINAKCPLGKW